MERPRFNSFKAFYPYYLSEHSDPWNRWLHFVGTSLALCFLLMTIFSRDLTYLGFAVLSGYFFAWIGHFFVEKNRPATFRHPFYSLLGDFVMYGELLTRRRSFSSTKSPRT